MQRGIAEPLILAPVLSEEEGWRLTPRAGSSNEPRQRLAVSKLRPAVGEVILPDEVVVDVDAIEAFGRTRTMES